MSCSFCDKSIPEEEYEFFHTCYYCEDIVCDDCSSIEKVIRCDCCNENVCSKCYPSLSLSHREAAEVSLSRDCKRCNSKNVCENCLSICNECKQTCCRNCVFENDICEKCFFEIKN